MGLKRRGKKRAREIEKEETYRQKEREREKEKNRKKERNGVRVWCGEKAGKKRKKWEGGG